MAKRVGSLYASLSLDSSSFSKGIQRSQQALNAFSKDMVKISGQVGKAFAAVTATVVGSLGYMTKQAMTSADALNDMAERIGISTERLGGLHYAAKLSGGSIESMNVALETMTENIGRTEMGTGRAKKAFEALGVNMSALKRMSPDQQFVLIADRISKLSSTAERAAAASMIFGGSWRDVFNVMREGAGQIEARIVEAQKLGITLTELDISKIDGALDSMTRLYETIKVVGNVMAVKLSPYIKEFADRLVDAANSGDGFKARVQTAIERVYAGFTELIRVVKIFQIALETVKVSASAVLLALSTGVEVVSGGWISFSNMLIHIFDVLGSQVAKSTAGMKLKYAEVISAIGDKFTWLFDLISSGFQKIGVKVDIGGSIKGGLADYLSDAQTSYDYYSQKLSESMESFEKAHETGFTDPNSSLLGTMAEFSDAMVKNIDESSSKIEMLWKEVTKDGKAQVEEFRRYLNSIEEKQTRIAAEQVKKTKMGLLGTSDNGPIAPNEAGFELLDKLTDKAWNDMKRLSDKSEETSRRIRDNYADAFADMVMNADFSFKSISKMMLQTIMKSILTRSFSGILGGLGGALGIKGFASGGFPQVGVPALVGERGPELIVPRSPVQVVPAAGGVTINQSLHFGEGVNAAARQAVLGMLPQIKAETVAAVDDARRRRGGRL